MKTAPTDADWLNAAARLAMRARPRSRPNPAVGAILVREGKVVARGWTMPGGRPHAEAIALGAAGAKAKGGTLYVTLEPCAHSSTRGPSCADLVSRSGIERIVIGMTDPDNRTDGQGSERIHRAGISVSHSGRSPRECGLAGYWTRRVLGRPHVTLKLAISLDGCIASASGESRWITGEAARAHVHSRRAMADAILVGGSTWRADRPALDVRLPGLADRSPERLILTRGETPAGVRAIASPDEIHSLEDIQYLYVEGGAGAASAFLSADLVDTIHLYRAPILIGAGTPAIGEIGLGGLSDAHGRWALAESRQLGSDRFEAYERRREG